jgi:phasin family protein
MFKIDQFAAANEAAINQFTYFAQLSLANVERFTELALGASLANAKDVHEVIALNSAALEPALKRAYTYTRTAYETAAETNNEVKRVLEKQTAEFNRAAVAALEEALKYAPAGSDTVVDNMKTAIAAMQSSYNNMSSINKQIYDTVEKTVEENASSVKSQATRAAKGKKR